MTGPSTTIADRAHLAMPEVLSQILQYKHQEVQTAKKRLSIACLEAEVGATAPPRGFHQVLSRASQQGYGIIAEIKKASPSKGLIRNDFDPGALARDCSAGGAACLSVLTDKPSFQGSADFLAAARQATRLPILRKDFVIDPWQVLESRSMGADCILLIMACVDDALAQEIVAAAHDWHLDVLVEVHDLNELERALCLQTPLIGINNRDLRTFHTDRRTTLNLAREVPAGKLIVAESGISTPDHLRELACVGVRCFLIGEALMRAANVAKAVGVLLASPLSADHAQRCTHV